MKTLILLLLSLSVHAQESLKVSHLVSSCSTSNDSICKGITNTKNKLNEEIKKNISPELLAPTLTILSVVYDREIKVKNTVIPNDAITIQPNKVYVSNKY